MTINDELINSLFEKAKENPRLRVNLDMRTNEQDFSQRMLNIMMPGTKVAIHRHPHSDENVIVVKGRMVEVFYQEAPERGIIGQHAETKGSLIEVERIELCPKEGKYGCKVPKGTWHTVEIMEPTVTYEAKDGKYGEDGTENWK